jgi:hypothetical protein
MEANERQSTAEIHAYKLPSRSLTTSQFRFPSSMAMKIGPWALPQAAPNQALSTAQVLHRRGPFASCESHLLRT